MQKAETQKPVIKKEQVKGGEHEKHQNIRQ